MSATFPQSNPIVERYRLNETLIRQISLHGFDRYIADEEYRRYVHTFPGEQYRLLAYLSTAQSTQTLFDIGTLYGYSALALSYNALNKVVSYNLTDQRRLHYPDELVNIDFRLGNVLKDPELLTASIILVDTAHDGAFERELITLLRRSRYQGLLVLDDIHLNAAMREVWESIIDLPKYDATAVGHCTGTGLVLFNDSL